MVIQFILSIAHLDHYNVISAHGDQFFDLVGTVQEFDYHSVCSKSIPAMVTFTCPDIEYEEIILLWVIGVPGTEEYLVTIIIPQKGLHQFEQYRYFGDCL